MEGSSSKPGLARLMLMKFGWPEPVEIKPVEQYQLNSVEYYNRIAWNFSKVIYPVLITMIATLYLGGSMGNYQCEYNAPTREGFTYNFDPLNPTNLDNEPTSFEDNTVVWVIIICVWFVFLVAATFGLVLILKHNMEWIMYYLLYFSVFVFLGILGGRYLFYWCRSICWDFDWITLVFLSANFCAGGLIAIFWKAPRWLNQGYLIALSALMGNTFNASVPEWTLWVLLAALVLWDLFAVLAPCGPLQQLVKIAGERQNDLPGLLYDTNPTARGREHPAEIRARRDRRAQAEAAEAFNNSQMASTGNGEVETHTETGRKQKKKKGAPAGGESSSANGVADNQSADPAGETSYGGSINAPSAFSNGTSSRRRPGTVDLNTEAPSSHHEQVGMLQQLPAQPRVLTQQSATARRAEEAREASKFLDKHLKLGLGDFVFYSVLVSLASRFGFMEVTTSFSGVMAGLCITFMVLITIHRPLPALPISLTLGIIAYFTTRYSLNPFVGNLLQNILFN